MALFLNVDPGSETPIYHQVADGIRGLIASGRLREGASLPPVRQLAVDLGVNLNTVAIAYRRLQEEGLVTVRHGSGAVVASRTTSGPSERELRKPLRSALTSLVLAGMDRAHIMALVASELKALRKGAE